MLNHYQDCFLYEKDAFKEVPGSLKRHSSVHAIEALTQRTPKNWMEYDIPEKILRRKLPSITSNISWEVLPLGEEERSSVKEPRAYKSDNLTKERLRDKASAQRTNFSRSFFLGWNRVELGLCSTFTGLRRKLSCLSEHTQYSCSLSFSPTCLPPG